MAALKRVEVVAALIISHGRVLATQRGYGDGAGRWEFPGGKTEPGECPQDALRREIREELDMDISVGNLLHTIEYDYPTFHLSMQCYLCTPEQGSPRLLEHTAMLWADVDMLDSIDWLPADWDIIPVLKAHLSA